MAYFKGNNSKLKNTNEEGYRYNKSSAESSVEKFNTKYIKASSGRISKLKEFKKPDGKSKSKIDICRSISVSLLSDFKTKLFECEAILTKYRKVVIEAEGSSIPVAINLGLQIKNQHSLPVSIAVSTGSKYIAVAPDSPIREYQNVPSITVTLSQSFLNKEHFSKEGTL